MLKHGYVKSMYANGEVGFAKWHKDQKVEDITEQQFKKYIEENDRDNLINQVGEAHIDMAEPKEATDQIFDKIIKKGARLSRRLSVMSNLSSHSNDNVEILDQD